jgi:hypothetical protein
MQIALCADEHDCVGQMDSNENRLNVNSKFLSLLESLPYPRPKPHLQSLQQLQKLIQFILNSVRSALRRSGAEIELADFVYNCFRKQHGLPSLVDQKGWDFISSLTFHRRLRRDIDLFASFLEGSRSKEELKVTLGLRC